MLTTRRLAEGEGFTVSDVRCDVSPGTWSAPEAVESYGVVFVRSGCFLRQSDGVVSIVDPTSIFFDAPGRERRVRHRSGDRYTSIALEPALIEPLLAAPLPAGAVSSPAFLDLEHRRLLALAHRTPESVDRRQITTLVRSAIARALGVRRQPATARREAVDAVRELLTVDPKLGLRALARRVSLSPYYLSRVFAAETGQTISDYRNCLRARAALERLADGERSLARMAADLGFADHAHLTRVVRREAGAPPSTLRELLRFGA